MISLRDTVFPHVQNEKQIENTVRAIWDKLDEKILEKLFLLKTTIPRSIIECDGGNDKSYFQHHNRIFYCFFYLHVTFHFIWM